MTSRLHQRWPWGQTSWLLINDEPWTENKRKNPIFGAYQGRKVEPWTLTGSRQLTGDIRVGLQDWSQMMLVSVSLTIMPGAFELRPSTNTLFSWYCQDLWPLPRTVLFPNHKRETLAESVSQTVKHYSPKMPPFWKNTRFESRLNETSSYLG